MTINSKHEASTKEENSGKDGETHAASKVMTERVGLVKCQIKKKSCGRSAYEESTKEGTGLIAGDDVCLPQLAMSTVLGKNEPYLDEVQMRRGHFAELKLLRERI